MEFTPQHPASHSELEIKDMDFRCCRFVMYSSKKPFQSPGLYGENNSEIILLLRQGFTPASFIRLSRYCGDISDQEEGYSTFGTRN